MLKGGVLERKSRLHYKKWHQEFTILLNDKAELKQLFNILQDLIWLHSEISMNYRVLLSLLHTKHDISQSALQ